MCGFAGFVQTRGTLSADAMATFADKMADTLQHRGPDDRGSWTDPHCGVALGHRRLSIIDLSVEGHQPMASRSGRYVTVFNGEIYNFQALREELGGRAADWRGHSDTEVMLAAFEKWGVERALGRFNGMFAFALWDREKRDLYLARDRMGEKPCTMGGWGQRSCLAPSSKRCGRIRPGMAKSTAMRSLPI